MILRELLVKLGLDIDEAKFAKGQLAAEVLKAGLSKVAEMATEAVHSMVEMVNKTAESGVEILEFSRATGISTDRIQDFMTAAAFTNVSVGELRMGLQSLSRNMNAAKGGSDEAQKAFTKLGVKITDASGKLRGADEVMLDVADRFKAMPDGPEKLAMSMTVMGKAGRNMVEMLSEGREGIEELAKETPNLTEAQIQASKEIVKTRKQIALVTENLWQRAIGPLLPMINELLKRWLQFKRENAEIMRQRIEKYLGLVVKAVRFLGDALELVHDNAGLVKTILGAGGLIFVFNALSIAAVKAALATAASWVAAAAPFLLIAGAIAGILLVFDDLRGYAEGEDSLFGTFVGEIDKWLQTDPMDGPFMKAIKWFVQQLRDALGFVVEIYETINGRKHALSTGVNKNTTYKGPRADNTPKMGPKTRVEELEDKIDRGERLTMGEQFMLDQAHKNNGEIPATVRAPVASRMPEARPAVRTGQSAVAASTTSVHAPVTMTVVQQPGENGENFAQRVTGLFKSYLSGEIEAAVAGVKR